MATFNLRSLAFEKPNFNQGCDLTMNINELKVGLIGGTGEEGRGLALRWAMAGAQVVIGSRTIDRAKAAADELNELIKSDRIGYAENQTAIAKSEFALL